MIPSEGFDFVHLHSTMQRLKHLTEKYEEAAST